MTRPTYKYEGNGMKHRAICERALGKPLPPNIEIHHHDGDGTNNGSFNLVICEDKSYHKLLHRRTQALKACGHANWRKCVFCKEWGPPETMKLQQRVSREATLSYHKECRAAYVLRRYYINKERTL